MTATLTDEGEVSELVGNACPRGRAYAESECTHPVRVVTSTVRCEDGSVISVKTSCAVPKEKMFAVMKEINGTLAKCGTKIGDVIIKGVSDTEADVVATSNWGQ